jgi:hypothetical protein
MAETRNDRRWTVRTWLSCEARATPTSQLGCAHTA